MGAVKVSREGLRQRSVPELGGLVGFWMDLMGVFLFKIGENEGLEWGIEEW